MLLQELIALGNNLQRIQTNFHLERKTKLSSYKGNSHSAKNLTNGNHSLQNILPVLHYVLVLLSHMLIDTRFLIHGISIILNAVPCLPILATAHAENCCHDHHFSAWPFSSLKN
jgi:hypothetical protein